MAIVKQASGHKRQWFDHLPHLVCITAALTLISAALVGLFGQRLDTLASQAAEMNVQAQKDASDSAALEDARAQWEKKQVSLEKALLSAKLKIKAEQTTSASIRKRLVALQKEVAALKRDGAAKALKAAAPKPAPAKASAPVQKNGASHAEKSAMPASASAVAVAPQAQPPATASLPVSPKPAPAASPKASPSEEAAPENAPAETAGVETTLPTPASDTKLATATTAAPTGSETTKAPEKAAAPTPQAPPVKPAQSPLLAVPDADEAATE